MNNRTHNQTSASQIPPGNPLFDAPHPATHRSAVKTAFPRGAWERERREQTPPRSSAFSAVKQPPILTAENAENPLVALVPKLQLGNPSLGSSCPTPEQQASACKTSIPKETFGTRKQTPPRSSASSAVKHPYILTAEDAENPIHDAPPPATDCSAVKTAFPRGAWEREQTPPRSSASSAVKQPPILTAEDAENAENPIHDAPPPATDRSAVKTAFPRGAWERERREQTPPRSSASSAVKHPYIVTAEDAEDAENSLVTLPTLVPKLQLGNPSLGSSSCPRSAQQARAYKTCVPKETLGTRKTPPRSSASSAVKHPSILTAEDAENAENPIHDAPPPATDRSAVKTAFPRGAWERERREQTPPRSSASSAVKQPSILTAEDAEDAKQGRRLPNTTRKDAGAKELREALQDHDGHSPVTVTRTFYPPFRHVDRIEDYRTAYRVMKDRT